ncbi:hypothetical protein KC963_00640 [Candidatus Saccharibacteria bacterium]|nr:hypothetical protein [Candidatus Saccharibacteria bacterium]
MHLVLWRDGIKARRIAVEEVFFKKHLILYTYAKNPKLGMGWDKHFLREHYDLIYLMFDSFEQAALYGCKDPALFIVPKRGEWHETDTSGE